MWLMFHFARKGPSSLHTGRYHFEQGAGGVLADQPRQKAEQEILP